MVKGRSWLNEAIYTALNIILAVAILVVIRFTDSILLGMLLFLLSKWRVLAVRPRFWFVNIQANLVDIIVGLSYVLTLFAINAAPIEDVRQIVLLSLTALLYIGWLLLLKPKSKRIYVVVQAGVALLLGVSTLFSISFAWPVSVVVLIMWLIGYATARHALSSYDESHLLLMSLICGLALAEIGWVAYHWTIAYAIPFTDELLLPQVGVIALLLGFVGYKAYDSFHHHQKIRPIDIILPTLFSVSVVIVLLIFFNSSGSAI
ncbi:MAG: rane protein of unknown function [Candidatus Saccharibacteria bacterium]|nr:rane protein of unknown function [Candidatus Saccharibacteria bacterium]